VLDDVEQVVVVAGVHRCLPRNAASLSLWLSGLIMIEAGWEAARTWGNMSADGSGEAEHIP
jgi:hypothetical protein